jgi:glutamate-ammonia-ligase adenylyltransferase
MTRIAARDLSGLAPFEEIGRELAALAAASTEIAVRSAAEIVRSAEGNSGAAASAPFVVLALGKFGGEDLNFSSDIDILYVHGRPLVPEAASRTVFEHFCRVSETVTRLLHERTEDGFVFRVDLDLRPEGKSGVIVNSVDALTSYYEISGAPWERAALTKARPVAGDSALGLDVLSQLEPFVFPKLIDTASIDALKKIKGKINAELKKSKSGGFHVKLGLGGIREIEFFVTAFQLIYGGKDPALRERNTLRALALLRERGLVPEVDAARLENAYIFLRKIENRLQMEEERQTHRLPTESAHLQALARRMGFADSASFEQALREKTGFVADCFERLAS